MIGMNKAREEASRVGHLKKPGHKRVIGMNKARERRLPLGSLRNLPMLDSRAHGSMGIMFCIHVSTAQGFP